MHESIKTRIQTHSFCQKNDPLCPVGGDYYIYSSPHGEISLVLNTTLQRPGVWEIYSRNRSTTTRPERFAIKAEAEGCINELLCAPGGPAGGQDAAPGRPARCQSQKAD